jgi:putative addiction module component (TIGR02574 family)
MSPTMKALGIDRLSIPERIRLVEEIWDSIAETPEEIPLTDAQRAELDRRLAAYEVDPEAGPTWEAVRAQLWHQLDVKEETEK